MTARAVMDPFAPKDGYGQVISEVGARQIIRLDEHRVLKKGLLSRHEPAAIQFVSANTSIPVPKMYQSQFATGEGPDRDSYIVMEFVPGKRLDEVWPTLGDGQKVAICTQLGEYVSQLRELRGERIESVDGGPVTVGVRFPRQGGPFDTEKEFNDFLVEKCHKRLPPDLQFYSRAGLIDNHKIHFAHGDLVPHNILVSDSGCVTAVLDWENAAFLPEYWDLNKIHRVPVPRCMHDYHYYTHHIHPFDHVQEYLAMRFVMSLNTDI